MASSNLPPYALALLNTIAGPESAGKYDVIYGGSRLNSYADHPRKAVPIKSGPNAGKTSSAAGKYQFLGSTWDQYKQKLGLPDFKPASQDQAAWALASDTYRSKTGQNLDAVLQSGDPNAIATVGKVLNPIWTSLPGGIEQGTNTNRFVNAFQKNLGASPYAGLPDGPKGQEAYAPPGLAPATNAPSNGILYDPSIPQDVADFAASPEPKTLGERLQGAFKALADTPNAPMPRLGPMGDARATGDSLLKALNAPKFADLLLQKRLVG